MLKERVVVPLNDALEEARRNVRDLTRYVCVHTVWVCICSID